MGIFDFFKAKNTNVKLITPYEKIVSELNAKIKFYSEDVYETASYHAARFYEKYSNININNLDSIPHYDLLVMFMIKDGKFTNNVGKTIKFYTSLIKKAVGDNSNATTFDMLENLLGILINEDIESLSEDIGKSIIETETLCGHYYESEKDVFEGIEEYKELKDRIEGVSDIAEIFGVKIKNSTIKNRLGRDFDDLYNKIRELIECMKTVGNDMNSKKIAKMLTRYKNALNEFEKANKEADMCKCLPAVSSINDEELLKEIYLYMYNHNKQYYDTIEKQYEEKRKNSIYAYVDLFKKYALDFTVLDDNYKNRIMSDGIDNVKKKLEIISKFADKKDYYALIVSTQINTLLYIECLINAGFVDAGFVKSNIGVVANPNLFEEFKNNIEFLKNKINMRKLESKSFLLSRCDIVKENIVLLEKYGIDYKKCMNLSFLGESILAKLSLFIEVGLENEIITNPDILNIDIDLAKRILLTEMVDGKKINKNSFDDLVINPQLFFVSPSKVGKVLERDNTKYNAGGILDLSKTKSTKLSYILEGVIIPKTRVVETLPSMDDIIRPSLYSKEQIKTLEKSMIK